MFDKIFCPLNVLNVMLFVFFVFSPSVECEISLLTNWLFLSNKCVFNNNSSSKFTTNSINMLFLFFHIAYINVCHTMKIHSYRQKIGFFKKKKRNWIFVECYYFFDLLSVLLSHNREKYLTFLPRFFSSLACRFSS